MATIVLDCGIAGESSVSGTAVDGASAVTHTGKVEAIGIHDLVVGGYGSDRGDAAEIQLVRHRDRASPKLAEKCAAGESLGSVTIHIFKNDNGMKEILKLALGSTYVSRIEYGTADSKGIAFRRHSGREGEGAHSYAALYQMKNQSINDSRGYSRSRAKANPLFDESPGAATDNEVERIWLNFTHVTWTATGNTEGSYNNNSGKALA